jgi:hypothetical protein
MTKLVLGLIVGALSGMIAPAARAQMGTVTEVDQVIDGDELMALGIGRLADVLSYVRRGRFTTIDGFSYRASLNGLSNFQDLPPDVFVDGHHVESAAVGTDVLNLVGIPIDAVESVEISMRPLLLSGVLAERGAIHIRTRRAENRLTFKAGVSAANEVGDPGPYRSEGLSNIDTQGPDAEVSAGVGTGGLDILSAAVYRRHYLTKPGLLPRLHGLYPSSTAPMAEVLAPSLRFHVEGSRVDASIFGTGVRSRIYPYLPHAAREVALNYDAADISTMASFRIGARSILRSRLAASLQSARQPNGSSLPFAWERTRFLANLALGRALETLDVVLGGTAGVESVSMRSQGNYGWGEFYTAIAGQMAQRARYQAMGKIDVDAGAVAVKMYLALVLQPSSKHRFELSGSLIEALPHHQNPIEYWTRRDVEPDLFPETVSRRTKNVSLRAAGDLEWRWEPDHVRTIAAGIGVRHFARANLFRREISVVDSSFRTTSLSYFDVNGTSGTAWFEIEPRILPGHQRLYASWDVPVYGDELYMETWDAVPDAHVGLSMNFPLAPDFQFHGHLAHQTGSTWHEFAGVPGAQAKVPGGTRFELALYKRLGAGRLHLRLALSNLLRDDLKYHPVGDTFDLAARIDMRLRLGAKL